MDLSQVRWRKSSFSGGDNECVELAYSGHSEVMRDSKNPGGPILRIDLPGLVATVKAGRLDR